MNYTKIPDKINNFNLYIDTAAVENRLMGVTDEVTLPSWEYMAETINLAGFAGEFESPTEGQLQNASIEIPFANTSIQSMEVVRKDTSPIIMRSAQEFIDKTTGVKVYEGRVITVKGMTKTFNYGSLKKSGYGNPSVTKNITYYKDEIDGTTITEIDKINFKFVVNGEDKLAQINDLV